MLHRKFAVIKLWPELKAAEDECIARLKITAKALGLQCLEVDSFARLTNPPHTQLSQCDVDFVLSLHFETPKRYDIFSFVALWNPLEFFHEWGYRCFTPNLVTHDDFLSCDSAWADDHVRRIVSHDPMRDCPCLRLYHSLSEPLFEPTTGETQLFYAGINWERISRKRGRHQDLLELLDRDGDLRIYGPKIFHGVDVWAGYKSYVGPVPFDGVSIVRLINKAGVSLVLSSDAHRQSELMSSRLFESLAAGAVIICDENAFARRFFGDTLLYIDTTRSVAEVHSQVRSHLDWIRSEPAKASELAKLAQDTFREKFTLDRCLEAIYRELPARKEKLESLYKPKAPEEVAVLLLMPDFEPKLLEQHIASCVAQRNVQIRPVLVMDASDVDHCGKQAKERLASLKIPFAIAPVHFYERRPDGSIIRRRRIGHVIHDSLEHVKWAKYLCIVGPHERLFSDHLCSLLRVLQDRDTAGSAWADMLLFHAMDGKDFSDLSHEPDVHTWQSNRPLGFGRFLLRLSTFRPDLDAVLPYLDALPMHLLVGVAETVPSRRCTIVSDIQDPFNIRHTIEEANKEREMLIDYAPNSFNRSSIDELQPISLSLDRMEPKKKTAIAVELAHSIPVPAFLERLVFGGYRWWLRARK